MSEFKIKTLMIRKIGSVTYKADVNERIEISLEDLDFDTSDYKRDHEWLLLTPRNIEAAAPLHEFFLPEEWDYLFRFRTTNRGFAPQILAKKKGLDSGVILPCTGISEDDYGYVLYLFQEMFPNLTPVFPDEIARMDVEEQLKSEDVFSRLSKPVQDAFVDMLLERREEFLIDGYIDINPQKLWIVYDSEVSKAITEKIQREMEEKDEKVQS